MSLMRAFSKVDNEGRVLIPKNMSRQTRLEPGRLVEIKVQGPNTAQYLVIKPRRPAR